MNSFNYHMFKPVDYKNKLLNEQFDDLRWSLVKTQACVKDDALLEFLVDYLGMPKEAIIKGITSGRLRVKHCSWYTQRGDDAEYFSVKTIPVFSVKDGVADKYWKGM